MNKMLDAVNQTRPTLILLAEDEPGDRELLQIALTRNGSNCTLDTVEDGFAAMKYLLREEPYEAASTPDLVILDLNLPGKDGREVLQQMRAHDSFKGIPVIILSTSQDDGDVASAYRLGASSYIVKPGNFRDFNAIVRRLQEYWLGAVTLSRPR